MGFELRLPLEELRNGPVGLLIGLDNILALIFLTLESRFLGSTDQNRLETYYRGLQELDRRLRKKTRATNWRQLRLLRSTGVQGPAEEHGGQRRFEDERMATLQT
jgi:hypothetical protein